MKSSPSLYRRGLVLLWLLAIAGCSVSSMLQQEPAPEFLYLHDDIRVGDYARYYSADQDRYRYEFRVANQTGEIFEVVFRWLDGPLRHLEKHYFVRTGGKVDRAFLLDTRSNEQFPLAVEGVDPNGFYPSRQFHRFAKTQDLRIGAHAYRVEYSHVYSISVERRAALGGVQAVTADLIDPSVPFGVVKSAQDIAVEKSIIDYSEFLIKAALPDVFSTSQVLNAFLDAYQSEGMQFAQHFVIEEYGRGN